MRVLLTPSILISIKRFLSSVGVLLKDLQLIAMKDSSDRDSYDVLELKTVIRQRFDDPVWSHLSVLELPVVKYVDITDVVVSKDQILSR